MASNVYPPPSLLRILIAIVLVIPQNVSMIHTANFSPIHVFEEMSCFPQPPILGCFSPEGMAME